MNNLIRILVVTAASAMINAGLAANTSFLDDAVVARFKDDDVTMLMATIDGALALPEGESKGWENAKTGAHGRVTVLGAHQAEARECRRLRVENHARGRSGSGVWEYCRSGADGPLALTATSAR